MDVRHEDPQLKRQPQSTTIRDIKLGQDASPSTAWGPSPAGSRNHGLSLDEWQQGQNAVATVRNSHRADTALFFKPTYVCHTIQCSDVNNVLINVLVHIYFISWVYMLVLQGDKSIYSKQTCPSTADDSYLIFTPQALFVLNQSN